MENEKNNKDGVTELRRLYPADLEPAEGVAIFCCDLIFRNTQQRFLKKNGFERFVPISVPGGGGPLAEQLQSFPSPEKHSLEAYLRLLLEELGLKRVVFIGHSNCRWYKHNFPKEVNYESKIISDLRLMSEYIQKTFPGVKVEGLFYADRNEDQIRMKKIT